VGDALADGGDANVRAAATAGLVLALGAGAAGCVNAGGALDGEPDVTGVVAVPSKKGGPVLAEPSNRYFEGMSLLDGDPVILSSRDERVPSSELKQGDRVEVWVGDVCAESASSARSKPCGMLE
jgi:hypothetical protein